MNRVDLSTQVSERSGLTIKQAAAAVSAALDVITDALAAGDEVTLHGFGTFRARERSPRDVLHPTSKERWPIPAGRRVTFAAALALKRRLAELGQLDEPSAD